MQFIYLPKEFLELIGLLEYLINIFILYKKLNIP